MLLQRGLTCLLLAGLAWGQTPNMKPAAPTPGTASPEASKVGPDDPVITIQGLCDNPPADKATNPNCKTVITRSQFENILTTVAPKMPVAMKKQFANRYASGLIMANAADQQGLDKGPKYDEMMRLSRIQVLQQLVNQHVQEEAGQVPDKDIADYYEKNKANFEEADLQKIFIPRSKSLEPSKETLSDDAEQKRQADAEAVMKKAADEIHAKAAAGGGFEKLQQEAYDTAGLKNKPPATAVGKLRRRQLPATSQDAIMNLKPGEVSGVIDTANGYEIYKMVSKDTVPLEKATDEIKNTMRSQRMQEMMQAIQKSATPELNEAYFAAGPPPGAAPPPPPMGNMQMGNPPPPKAPTNAPSK